jgi:hypothetical protein
MPGSDCGNSRTRPRTRVGSGTVTSSTSIVSASPCQASALAPSVSAEASRRSAAPGRSVSAQWRPLRVYSATLSAQWRSGSAVPARRALAYHGEKTLPTSAISVSAWRPSSLRASTYHQA